MRAIPNPFRRPLFSPGGFVVTAVLLGLAYAAVHLGGLRAHTTVLSGTLPPGGAGGIALGLLYVLCYFACVVAAPILLIAAAILGLLERGTKRRAV